MIDLAKFPPVQRKMMAVLQDGNLHRPDELQACLWDDQGPVKNITPHLVAIRKVINPSGLEIICQHINHSHRYRLVRIVTAGE